VDKTNQAPAADRAPRHFASLFPPAKHLAYAADMLRLREQRAAERTARQVRR
jgi:hypothetical protein